MDIREQNYLGGRLFDFSIAITAPHLSLWTKLRFEDQIHEDMDYDLECIDDMAKQAEEEKAQDRPQSRRYALRRLASRAKRKQKN